MEFIPDLPTLLTYMVACLIIAVTPGPDMAFFVSRSISDGRLAGLAAMAGAMCGIVVHTMMVAFGLSALITASPAAFTVLKWAGAVYLVWLAIQAIREGSAFRVRPGSEVERSLARHWSQGLMINLLNPKIILFFMTFLPQFVSTGDPAAQGKFLFLGVAFIVIALPVVVPMVLAADGFARLLKRHPRVTRIIDYGFAGVFSAFAVKIALTQTR